MPDTTAATSPAVFQSIPLDQIRPSRHQARKAFDEAGIKGLADSIANEGLQNPVTVRKVDGGYELISGERRSRAMKLLGKSEIDAHVVDVPSEASAAAKGLVENLQRQDLNPVEEAEGFQELLNLGDAHWTQEQIGKVAGKDQTYVSKSLALLKLPPTILESMRQRILSREHGVELLRLNNANSSKSTANKIIKGGWSVKKTREAIDKKKGIATKNDVQPNGVSSSDPLSYLWPLLQKSSKIAVPGSWKVHYASDGWHFDVNFPEATAQQDLAKWFGLLGMALGFSGKTD